MSIVLVGSTSGSITLQEPAVAGTTVLDLPATSGNVVVDSATQTLTNKTLTFITAPANNDKITVRTFFYRLDASGTNTYVQFNDSNDISGSPGFTFNKTTNNVSIANTLSIAQLIFTASNPPATAASNGVAGTIAWDSSYIYVCVATNTWKRVQIATWP